MEEGIYFGMPLKDYLAAPGLSHSGVTDMLQSPLTYWHKHVSPDRKPAEPSAQMRQGSRLHCRLLEPSAWPDRYAEALSKDDHPGREILDTNDELKAWLKARGHKVSGNKADLLARVEGAVAACPEHEQPLLWDRVEADHEAGAAGKEILTPAERSAVEGAARAALAEPAVARVLHQGHAEVSFFVRDPKKSGVLLKARMDCVTPYHTADLKSFSLKGDKNHNVRQTQCRALYFERYFSQGVFYSDVRELARQRVKKGAMPVHGRPGGWWLEKFAENAAHGFYFLFVEMAAPHHLGGFRMDRPVANGPTPEAYWEVARSDHAQAIELFLENASKHGPEPWRDALDFELLSENDMPRLMHELEEMPWPAAGETVGAAAL